MAGAVAGGGLHQSLPTPPETRQGWPSCGVISTADGQCRARLFLAALPAHCSGCSGATAFVARYVVNCCPTLCESDGGMGLGPHGRAPCRLALVAGATPCAARDRRRLRNSPLRASKHLASSSAGRLRCFGSAEGGMERSLGFGIRGVSFGMPLHRNARRGTQSDVVCLCGLTSQSFTFDHYFAGVFNGIAFF